MSLSQWPLRWRWQSACLSWLPMGKAKGWPLRWPSLSLWQLANWWVSGRATGWPSLSRLACLSQLPSPLAKVWP